MPDAPNAAIAPSTRLEPIIKLLSALMIFFTAALFLCVLKFSDDGQLFQVISGLLTAISGGFMMRIKPPSTTPLPIGPTLTPNPPDQTVTATLTPPATAPTG